LALRFQAAPARCNWRYLHRTRPLFWTKELPMSAPQPEHTVQLRRADNNERFVAFAFAGADMVAEIDADRTVTYAAGAFRTRFGCPPEEFLGHAVRELVAAVDHEALDSALSLLLQRGRLLPLTIRLADAQRTRVALAGIVLSIAGRPVRLCLTFAVLPAPLDTTIRATTAHTLARATEARLRAGTPCDFGLIEISAEGRAAMSSSEAIGCALEAIAPNALAGEIAPGRFGLLGAGDGAADLLTVATLLEQALRAQGVEVAVAAHHLTLGSDGLTLTQAARALRQALNVFAREGAAGMDEAGFAGGLAGYIAEAGAHTSALRQAIRGDHFEMVFQPIVSLTDRRLHHYEALIRPKPIPGCPFSGPQEFVLLVEALGLADELDLKVAQLANGAAAGAEMPIAFNLSGQSVQSGAFREKLLELLTRSPARKAGLIMVEMTETAEIEDLSEATRTADALRAMSVPFCLDDFGAGAADVRLLRALTPDFVKLDGSYVPSVVQSGRERALVGGMVEIARAVGAAIVAERVETESEAEALRSLGITYGQGWLFGRPGPLPQGGRRKPAAAGGMARARRRGEVKEVWGWAELAVEQGHEVASEIPTNPEKLWPNGSASR
jgi:EAL domain-containing protein (putative c-di-GMP-specific phosphodiesterase class I)/PAS domain-containing protein